MTVTNLLTYDPIVIAFGHRSQHGKDAAAAAIMRRYGTEYGIERYAFADALKEEFYDVLLQPAHPFWSFVRTNYLALPHPRGSFASQTSKRLWVNQNKTELGDLLQRYGTDFVRAKDQFYWIRRLRARIEHDRPRVALITDLRFFNEVLFVRACNGYTVKITRENFINPLRDPAHPSETALEDFAFDYEIRVPDGALDQLEDEAIELFQLLIDKQQPVLPQFADFEAVSLIAAQDPGGC